MTTTLRFALLAVFLLTSVRSNAEEQQQTGKRLNVLLIISDDLNCRLGCYGDRVVKSPNIDRLAERGVRFDRAYCNYPVCNASRVSFLSGRFPETTKVLGNGTDPRTALGKDFQFLPEYFRANGYFTAGFGKIAHGRFPDSIRWDIFAEPARGIAEEDDQAPAKAARKAKKGKKAARKPADTSVPFDWEAADRSDDQEPDGQVARKVVKLLEERRDKPFFIAAGFHKPHVPHTAPRKYFDLYDAKAMPLPMEPPNHVEKIPRIAFPAKHYPDLTLEQQRAIIWHYHSATTFMDAQVGLLLDAMDQLKLWDNTVVVFMGDHGWHLGEHDGFWAKVSLMEESARTPLLVAAPGLKHAGCKRVVQFVDLFPTLTELCGLPAPAGLEGASLVPLLKKPDRDWDKAAYTVVSRGRELGRAIRTDAHTYIEWPDGSTQLYDAKGDPREYRNLSGESQSATVMGELKRLLAARRGQ